jgi:hypothetical protein
LVRTVLAARDAFTDKLAGIIELIAAHLDSGTQRERRRKAVALYGLMVGTLQLARAVNDKQLSEEICRAAPNRPLPLPASVAIELVAASKIWPSSRGYFGGILAVGGEALVEHIGANRID